jgi:hypothetical protein
VRVYTLASRFDGVGKKEGEFEGLSLLNLMFV